jgi:hypothetical protein
MKEGITYLIDLGQLNLVSPSAPLALKWLQPTEIKLEHVDTNITISLWIKPSRSDNWSNNCNFAGLPRLCPFHLKSAPTNSSKIK